MAMRRFLISTLTASIAVAALETGYLIGMAIR